MQVRCLVLDHEGEQLGEIHYNPPAAREIPAVFQGIMATISDNLQVVRERIARAARAAGRDPVSVTLLAVSKSQPVARVEEARAAGHQAFGENYVQEALGKMDALPGLEWHLIGPLQSNKTRVAAERFAWVHTLEREKIARRLSEQRPAGLPPLNVLIQVNVSGEATKSGVAVEAIAALARAIAPLPRLRLRGLMAVPEPTAELASQRMRFRAVKSAFENFKRELGVDNRASALIGGLLKKGVDASRISVVEVSPAARERLAALHGVRASDAPDAAMQNADTLVLAVKPQDLRPAAAALAGSVRGKLVVSIAAGVRLDALSRWLGGHRKLVRCMPNTPALIGAGISGLYALPEVSQDERKRTETILGAVGEVVWLPEERLLDPVTAVSGSGPAYVFWFIEQLAESAKKMGIPPDVALKLALHTVLGAAKLAVGSEESPAELRKNVTSKGGTTEAALKVFDEEQLAQRFARALEAASRRGADIGAELGKI